MLKFHGRAESHDCSGATRRDFLQVGAVGLGALTLPALLRARAAQAADARRDTAVVWLFLSGGPSHIDTYDMKPAAPAEFRGPFHPIQTNLPGTSICELMPKQTRVMDKLSIVRTFSHADGNHGSAVHWVATGVLFPPADLGEPQIAPFPGSVAARVRGTNPQTGMPPYVSLNRMPTSDGPAYLGVGCAPLETSGPARRDLTLPTEINLERLRDRRHLLGRFDRLRRDLDARGTMSGMDAFEQQAFDLVLGKQAREAFDLSLEDRRVVARYGGGLGEQMLAARRLCEAGAAFVTIEWCGGGRYGWDGHARCFEFLEKHLPQLDHAVATFVDDVAQRGLAEKILLVVLGEMGRTPKINERAGRDHWPQVMFVTLAGGGLKMGRIVGESSERGETALTRTYAAGDLLATVYHVLGIDPGLSFYNNSGRPVPILPDGKPVAELL
ncbi:MAG TPA: DUF1501 domain-containing protein [Pirellulales bacterium]|nr:DUF1501 domain-containing protein [Pirellulales bacterium]